MPNVADIQKTLHTLHDNKVKAEIPAGEAVMGAHGKRALLKCVASVAFIVGGVMMVACSPQPTGKLKVTSGSNVVFSNDTGLAQSWFSTTHSLGLAGVIPFSAGSLSVHYADPFSTLASQEEVVVMARDPIEYRTTLESIAGPSPDSLDPGRFLEWSAETFACGDIWPVPNAAPLTFPPNGVTLPFAVSFPFPDQATPQLDWALTQNMFAGGGGAFPCGTFAGAAASFEGSTKGISVMRHGVCSREASIQEKLSTLAGSLPLHFNVLGFGYDVADLGVASFVDFAPKGGFVVTTQVDTSQIFPFPVPILVNPGFQRNYTYFFSLDDGIASIDSPTVNISNDSGPDPIGAGGMITGLLNDVMPNRVKLAALEEGQPGEGQPGTFAGGQAQPIPRGNDPVCSTTTGQRPAFCFTPCENNDTVDMSNPSTWPAPENAGDRSKVDPPSWHDKQFCRQPVSLFTAFVSGAGSPALASTLTEPLTLSSGEVDSTKLHNWRCNFYPRYEAPTPAISVTSIDPLTSGAPFNAGAKQITTGPPVCELIVRIKRLNVFPDTVEAVFFDGSSLTTLDPGESTGNEAFAVFTGLGALPGGAGAAGIAQMCKRKPEQPGSSLQCGSDGICDQFSRSFAHIMLP